MAIIEKNSQPFEPYARLMNIIGDQLITNKIVGVIEVVKNCYDADAENVHVRFFNMNNYGKNYLTEKERPYIEIEDDGEGMTLNTITDVWLRPATPNKLDKRKNKKDITKKGRIIQGEKGIGRFAIHKLGEKIEVFTKAKDQQEVKLEMDFSEFNPEKVDLFNQPPVEYKLLNEVHNKWYVYDTPEEIKKPHGTLIRIYHLREEWRDKDFEDLYKAVLRLIPPIDSNAVELGVKEFKTDFDVKIYKDNSLFVSEHAITFKDVIEQAQFVMLGSISKDGVLFFEYKSTVPPRKFMREINLLSKEDLAKFNYASVSIERWFSKYNRKPACGEFNFSFYAFDLSKPDKTILTKPIEQFIKDNFVFVLRDGVRVYPYGEKGEDWLNLDKLRATVRAGQFISYNDLTGFVYISREGNPVLKDATNRQGIMDVDGALEDFKNLVTAATEIFNTEIKIDKGKLELKRNAAFKDSNSLVTKSYQAFEKSLEKIDNRDVIEKANKFLETVNKHNSVMKDRMETVEDLAGLGMAVEKASHDALMLLAKMRGNIKSFKVKAKNKDYENKELLALLDELDENLNFVYDEMQVIQPLFKIQRKAIQDVSVYDSIEKVVKYFRREIDNKIDVSIKKDNDVIIRTNNGLILQVLINLLDNAIYWVNKNEGKKPEIVFQINTKASTLTIADNGPGIREDVELLIFNEFFSLKSDGRGLGLYITKEILLRIDAEISLIKDEKQKLLPGANFSIKFNNEPQ
ncbi:MAG: sensor histidine kinase [Saprospiraceae bacterium]|nr:sensor histidine kinase [Saprospiraceae bacterium]